MLLNCKLWSLSVVIESVIVYILQFLVPHFQLPRTFVRTILDHRHHSFTSDNCMHIKQEAQLPQR